MLQGSGAATKQQAAEEAGRPYIYLNHQQRKEELDKQIAHRDDIHGRIRQPGARVKHWMKRNWIKMYNKNSTGLRVETVINHPYDFRIYRSGRRSGKTIHGWCPMSKCVANLYRYVEICLGATRRTLDALAGVDDPGPSRRELKELGYRPRERTG